MGVHVFLVHTVCVVRGHGQTRKGEYNLLSRASIWILPCTRRGWQQLVILSPYHTKPSSFRHNLPPVEIRYTNNTYKMTTRCVFIPLCSSLHHQGLQSQLSDQVLTRGGRTMSKAQNMMASKSEWSNKIQDDSIGYKKFLENTWKW